ncbi:hypothetical protein HCH_01623 [Hahella chejuensis KCTC 2396]|uniref:Uncharacterized protein n=1 Tax=Hahella chejuensis (strain KCTC 2396) TaxID=349521 RepID=Q2SLJ5_HAHCH|nr:hypothetical protein HCH_01623 [Hahella chejuensis KCTC 2396]
MFGAEAASDFHTAVGGLQAVKRGRFAKQEGYAEAF